MHSILKRSAALIASAATLLGGGMLMAGTAQADGIFRFVAVGVPWVII